MYTHTIEIVTSAGSVLGEVGFDGGEDINIKIPENFEVTSTEMECLSSLINQLGRLVRNCGGLIKMEVIKK